jgi:hypothetical protein
LEILNIVKVLRSVNNAVIFSIEEKKNATFVRKPPFGGNGRAAL